MTGFEPVTKAGVRESLLYQLSYILHIKTRLHCVKVAYISLRYHSSGGVKVR